MRDTIDRVALRYLAAVLLGLVLLLLHELVRGGPAAVLVPQRASPWELSKLVFWPVLGAGLLTLPPGAGRRDRWSGTCGGGAGSLGAAALNGVILAAGGSGRLCLAVWAGALAAERPSAPTAPAAPGSGWPCAAAGRRISC
jgi:hypothetical protein